MNTIVRNIDSVKILLLAFFGILIGLLCLEFSFKLLIILLLITFLALTWIREEFGILILIVLTASVIYEDQLPSVKTQVGNFHLIDIFLLFFLASIIIKIFTGRNKEIIRTPLDIPLIVFWLCAIFSLLLAVNFFSVPVRTALSELRIITYYLIFFLVTNLIQTKTQLKRLVNGLYLIALVVVLFVFIQMAFGDSFHLMPARVESLLTLGEKNVETTRIIPPGNSLIFAMFIVGVCHFLLYKTRLYFSIIIMLLLCGLIIGFNRNLWVPAIVMLGYLFCVVSSHIRIKAIIVMCILLFGLGIITIYAYISEGKLQAYVTSTYDRLFSLTRGSDLIEKGTLIDRVIENKFAYHKIVSYPIFGIGLGNDYRDDVEWNPKLNAYIHNGFLWILMKMGFLGFIPFLFFLIYGSIRGIRYWNTLSDPFYQSICIGFTLVNIGFMMSSLVNPVFMQWHSTPIIGLILGGNEIIYRLDG